MESGDAMDVKKRDREDQRLWGRCGREKKRQRETERSERERENSRFEFKLLAGKVWFLGTLGTQKKETERMREVKRL